MHKKGRDDTRTDKLSFSQIHVVVVVKVLLLPPLLLLFRSWVIDYAPLPNQITGPKPSIWSLSRARRALHREQSFDQGFGGGERERTCEKTAKNWRFSIRFFRRKREKGKNSVWRVRQMIIDKRFRWQIEAFECLKAHKRTDQGYVRRFKKLDLIPYL